MLKAKKLKNGLRYHLVPYDGTDAATILVLAKVGSRYEPVSVLGGSHFIEHLMFKGTKRHPKTIDISKKLDRYGAEYNAYTGKDMTGYYVKIAGEHLEIAVDLLHDMLFHSKFAAAEIDRERQVIIEEIKMYEENPIMHIEDLIEEALFDGNPLGRNIAGSVADIQKMKRGDILDYRNQYYVPSQMVVVLAGKLPKNARQLLESTFGKVASEAREPASFMPFGQMPARQTLRLARQYKPLKQIQLALAWPASGKASEALPATKLLANILGGTMSSRLFIEVREKRGLCYFIRAGAEAYEDIGTFVIRAGLDAARLDEALKTIAAQVEKIKKHGVTAEELHYAQENLAGRLKLRLENSSDQAEFFGRQELFLGETKTVDEKMAEYQAVTRQEIKKVAAEVLDWSRAALAAIGPYKTDAALRKHVGMVT